MSDSEIPSKTDAPAVSPEDSKTIMLSSGEHEYLKGLQEQNKYLTLTLGDKAMEYEALKRTLTEHRETLMASYRSILNVHGAPNGRIDLTTGAITIVK